MSGRSDDPILVLLRDTLLIVRTGPEAGEECVRFGASNARIPLPLSPASYPEFREQLNI
jgi:hypothetical protein